MAKWIQFVIALTIFGLSAFLAGLNGGYQIHMDETVNRGLYHGDSFVPLFQGYLWISVAMLLILAFTTFAKGMVARIGSFFAVFLAIFFYSFIIWRKSFFIGEILESGIFTWAFPIDILIGLLMLGLLILQFFRRAGPTESDTSPVHSEKLPN